MLRLARQMGMTVDQLKATMSGQELVEHVAEMRLTVEESQ